MSSDLQEKYLKIPETWKSFIETLNNSRETMILVTRVNKCLFSTNFISQDSCIFQEGFKKDTLIETMKVREDIKAIYNEFYKSGPFESDWKTEGLF